MSPVGEIKYKASLTFNKECSDAPFKASHMRSAPKKLTLDFLVGEFLH